MWDGSSGTERVEVHVKRKIEEVERVVPSVVPPEGCRVSGVVPVVTGKALDLQIRPPFLGSSGQSPSLVPKPEVGRWTSWFGRREGLWGDRPTSRRT